MNKKQKHGLELAMQCVISRAKGDSATLTKSFNELVDYGPQYLYAACGVWARMVVKLGRAVAPHSADCDGTCSEQPANVRLMFVDGSTMEPVEPDEVAPESVPTVWAARFVAAVAANDEPTMNALFVSMLDDADDDSDDESIGRSAWSMVKLIGMAANALLGAAEHVGPDGNLDELWGRE